MVQTIEAASLTSSAEGTRNSRSSQPKGRNDIIAITPKLSDEITSKLRNGDINADIPDRNHSQQQHHQWCPLLKKAKTQRCPAAGRRDGTGGCGDVVGATGHTALTCAGGNVEIEFFGIRDRIGPARVLLFWQFKNEEQRQRASVVIFSFACVLRWQLMTASQVSTTTDRIQVPPPSALAIA